MKTVLLETKSITDWDSFHSEFARLMGFPDFYGHNMNAWIDCMSYLNDANAGMSKIILENGEALVINVADTEGFKKRLPEIFEALVECKPPRILPRRVVREHGLEPFRGVPGLCQ